MKKACLPAGRLLCLLLLSANPLCAQTITPAVDGTDTRITQDGHRYIIHGGSLSGDGQNLFHSFQEFGLDPNQIADFLANPNLRNILGRVTGSNASIIDGLLRVTGGNANLFLMNPSGIVFGPNANLDVSGSFTATTADAIGFAGGRFNASGPNSYSVLVGVPNQFIFAQANPAAIFNQADLAVGADQSLTLAAGSIINEGSLSGGQIAVAAVPGTSRLRISQPGMLLSLEIERPGTDNEEQGTENSIPTQSLTPGTQNLTNLPTLLAGGNLHHAVAVETAANGSLHLVGSTGHGINEGNIAGTVIELDAHTLINRGSVDASGEAGGSIKAEVDSLVNAGYIRADGFTEEGGSIQIAATGRIAQTASAKVSATGGTNGDGGTVVLDAGAEGTVILSGEVNVSARENETGGGRAEILGERIGLFGASVDASGDSSGGTILVGGDYQGQGTIRRALSTAVNPSSTITADALTRGDGGTIVLWADGTTHFDGKISARGGPESGDGGTIEVSGLQGGRFAGIVDAAAPAGSAGTLLLDPKNITITDGPSELGLLQTLLNPTPAASDQFGFALAIDGSTVAIGASAADAVYLFDASSGSLLQTLLNPTPVAGDQFGTSVAIDGNTVVVGAPLDDTGGFSAGAAYLFDASSGSLLQTLLKPTPAANDEFGGSVAIDGNTVVVGTRNDDAGAGNAGAAYLFDASSGTQTQTLLNPTPAGGDEFGTSVAIDGSTVVVGAPLDDTGAGNAGAAYLFDASSGTQTQTLLNPTPAGGDEFGWSVAIDGGTVVVGAFGDDTGAVDAGAAYLFDASSGTQTHTLFSPTPAGSAQFGTSVAIDGNTVAIGSPSPVAEGTAYLFDASSGDLTQTLLNPTPAGGDFFGGSVAIDGSTVVVGASFDDAGATDAGAAYLLDTPTQFSHEESGSFRFDADRILQITNSGTHLTLQTSNDITINEAIIANNPSGSGGALTLQAGRSILIHADIFTDDGDLTLLANESLNSGVVDSFRMSGDAVIAIDPSVTLNLGSGNFSAILGRGEGLTHNSSSNISLGNLIAGTVSVQNNGPNGGSIIAEGAIQASGSTSLSASSTVATGDISTNGNPLTLTSTNGAITTGNLSTANTSSGGSIFLDASSQITTGTIDSSSTLGAGGSVTLDPSGDVQVSWINTNGGTFGGDIDITAGQFFRATDSFIDRNGILASLSSTGGTGGGDITIRHGGSGIIPFIVGNAALNGTAAAITSGEFAIAPLSVLPFTTTVGNIEIISVNSSSNPIDLFFRLDFLFFSPDSLRQVEAFLPETTLDLLTELENYFTRLFDRYLEQEQTPLKTLNDAQSILSKIEQATGVKPALIYVFFTPQDTIPAAPESGTKTLTSVRLSKNTSEALWQFTAQGLSSKPEAGIAERNRPIRADDLLNLVLVTSKGEFIQRRIPGMTRKRVQQIANRFRRGITDPLALKRDTYLAPAQQLYRWLVAPLEGELVVREIDNLVFILDSGLRSLPLAAMHDGEGFIVERYSVGLMPSLSLTDTRYMNIKDVQVLAMGAAEFPGQDQRALPGVPVEIAAITDSLWSGRSALNKDFTAENLHQIRQVQPFGILHLATHANFLPGSPSNSYIQWWNYRHSFNQLQQQVQFYDPPIEMLVLSACKTAIGDPEAELGFAGMAVQTGVKTGLGSLWHVSDEGTMGLMTNFYGYLKEAPIKAEALRRAQVAMLKGEVRLEDGQLVTPVGQFALPPELARLGDRQLKHPYHWSAFTMIGNPW